jgi:3-methyladenine DNA glycosylase AlkD
MNKKHIRAKEVVNELLRHTEPERAEKTATFFKTGKGEYGEGDKFHGIKMGPQRKIAKKYYELEFSEAQKLLDSDYHEERMVGLLILVYKYQKNRNDQKLRKEIADFYLANLQAVNNWDLVDVTAPYILGKEYLEREDRDFLYNLANSDNLWERRVAILTTFEFIKDKQFIDTLKLAEILLEDEEDLIHKAVGWMLREIGKRDQNVEEVFLKKHYQGMPRTMLRYAIEKFDEPLRQKYLNNKI